MFETLDYGPERVAFFFEALQGADTKRNERIFETFNIHQFLSLAYANPLPPVPHNLIIERCKDWYAYYKHKKYQAYGESQNQPQDEIRVKKEKDDRLVLEEPAHYNPSNEQYYDTRWVFDKNGRLVSLNIGQYNYYVFNYSPEGHLTRIYDIHNGGYGSETILEWQKNLSGQKKLVTITTQFFSGKGGMQRGSNDGDPIVTNFQPKK